MISICDESCGHCGRCEGDPRTPCITCGDLTNGCYCDRCMDDWRADEAARKYAAETHQPKQGAA